MSLCDEECIHVVLGGTGEVEIRENKWKKWKKRHFNCLNIPYYRLPTYCILHYLKF